MKIAITHENGNVYSHFGHTKEFKIYNVKESGVMKMVISTNGSGHSQLVDFLKKNNVDVLICGGIGGCAIEGLSSANIKFYAGVSGDCDEAFNKFMNNELVYTATANCDHHSHNHNDGDECCH